MLTTEQQFLVEKAEYWRRQAENAQHAQNWYEQSSRSHKPPPTAADCGRHLEPPRVSPSVAVRRSLGLSGQSQSAVLNRIKAKAAVAQDDSSAVMIQEIKSIVRHDIPQAIIGALKVPQLVEKSQAVKSEQPTAPKMHLTDGGFQQTGGVMPSDKYLATSTYYACRPWLR